MRIQLHLELLRLLVALQCCVRNSTSLVLSLYIWLCVFVWIFRDPPRIEIVLLTRFITEYTINDNETVQVHLIKYVRGDIIRQCKLLTVILMNCTPERHHVGPARRSHTFKGNIALCSRRAGPLHTTQRWEFRSIHPLLIHSYTCISFPLIPKELQFMYSPISYFVKIRPQKLRAEMNYELILKYIWIKRKCCSFLEFHRTH